MTDQLLSYLEISEASGRIKSKSLSPVELTQAALDRIEAKDGEVQAFVTLMREAALADAAAAEKRVQGGDYRGPLDGIPIGIQIVGKPFEEATTLRVADAYQQATDWHKRRPPL